MTVVLKCKKCRLKSECLHIGWGMVGTEYAVAWCNDCRRFTTVPVAYNKPYEPAPNAVILLDDRSIAVPPYLDPPDSRKHRCLRCWREVELYDMEKRPCPACGEKMEAHWLYPWE